MCTLPAIGPSLPSIPHFVLYADAVGQTRLYFARLGCAYLYILCIRAIDALHALHNTCIDSLGWA
jgi:hypothetical protein